MSNLSSLFEALSKVSGLGTLINVKFFLGESPEMDQDGVCRQSLGALEQVSSGVVQAQSGIDGKIDTASINRFI